MTRYELIRDHRDVYPVSLLAELLEVSPSGFYEWLDRPPSDRQLRREGIADAVRAAFDDSYGIYGSRKITEELAARGVRVCRNTIAGLMNEQNLRSRTQKRRFVVTTNSAHAQPVAPNQLNRDFSADGPDLKWVADITFVPTASGWAYLAAVMDLYSRRIVGWAVSDTPETALVLDALEQAIETRRPHVDLIHHSDRGCQYASDRYRRILERHGIACSMSRRGDCWDNAPMERFMGAFKNEWAKHHKYDSVEEVHTSAFKYIETFYNRRRRHQALGYMSPNEYEQRSEAAA